MEKSSEALVSGCVFPAVLGIRRRGCDDDRRGRAELTGQLVPASTPTPYPRSMCTPRT